MSRIIKGTRDLKGRIVMKQATGGMGRLRCMKCQGLMIDALDTTTGTPVKRCQGCGQQVTITTLGAQPTAAASVAARKLPQRPGARRP